MAPMHRGRTEVAASPEWRDGHGGSLSPNSSGLNGGKTPPVVGNTSEVGCSSRPPRTKFEWNRPLGLAEQPYLRRWRIPLPGGWSIRLHRWLHDDDNAAHHDHPAWFWTWVLRGGYMDATPARPGMLTDEFDLMVRGDIRFRPASHIHAVLGVKPNTWTLCLFGREQRRWNFYPVGGGRPVKRDKWFAEKGHHTPTGERIRLRPDGSPINPMRATVDSGLMPGTNKNPSLQDPGK